MLKNVMFFVFIVALSSPIFISCEKKEKSKDFVNYYGPILTVDNLAVNYSDSGRVKVKMSTAKQLKFENQNEVYPKPVYVNFLDNMGVEYSSLRGDSGRKVHTENLYIIKGNVYFFNRLLQQSLATEELYWNPVSKKIYTNKKVTIKTPRESITASSGMEATEDFSRYSLKKPKGVFMVDSLRTIVDTTEQN